GARLWQYHQPALDGLDAGRGNTATDGGQLLGGAQQPVQQRLQVLEIQQQEALLIGPGEYAVERGQLIVIEVQQAGQQQRSHLAAGRAQWLAAVTEDVPGRHGHRFGLPLQPRHQRPSLVDTGRRRSGGSHTGQIALDIGGEYRHAGSGKALGQYLQGDCLAGAGGPGDQTVTVAHAQG